MSKETTTDGVRAFEPLHADHPLVTRGMTCRLCGEAFLEGERPCLLPSATTDDPNIVEAAPAHWTCHVVTERRTAAEARLEQAVESLVARASPAVDVLRELEWSGKPGVGGEPTCPACEAGKDEHHDPFCRLAIVLRSADAEQEMRARNVKTLGEQVMVEGKTLATFDPPLFGGAPYKDAKGNVVTGRASSSPHDVLALSRAQAALRVVEWKGRKIDHTGPRECCPVCEALAPCEGSKTGHEETCLMKRAIDGLDGLEEQLAGKMLAQRVAIETLEQRALAAEAELQTIRSLDGIGDAVVASRVKARVAALIDARNPRDVEGSDGGPTPEERARGGTVHDAAVASDGVQTCTRCGEILVDNRNTAWPDGQEPPSFFASGPLTIIGRGGGASAMFTGALDGATPCKAPLRVVR